MIFSYGKACYKLDIGSMIIFCFKVGNGRSISVWGMPGIPGLSTLRPTPNEENGVMNADLMVSDLVDKESGGWSIQ